VVAYLHFRPDGQEDGVALHPSRGAQASFRLFLLPSNQRDEAGKKDHLTPESRLVASHIRCNWVSLQISPR